MAEDKPWWKKIWPALLALGALALGVLGAIFTMKGRAALAGKDAEAQQKKDNEETQKRLGDVDAVKKAELEAANAKKELAEEKAKNAHEERVRAIDDASKKEADKLAADPSALPGGFLESLRGTDRKLGR